MPRSPLLLLLLACAAAAEPLLAALPADALKLTTADRERAALPRPLPTSHVHGKSPAEAFAKMNAYLTADPILTAPCEHFDHDTLDDVARILHAARAAELNEEYVTRGGDRRALHFGSLEEKETLWRAERQAAAISPSHAVGTPAHNATRDGKCAELIMWYIHHLAEGTRAHLAQVSAFTLPLMPADVAPKAVRSAEYDRQIGCTSCHVAVHIPGAPPMTPIPYKNSSAPQYPTNCPVDPKTGEPSVWYEELQGEEGRGNRVKRCDWDYEPFCEPCEGVGGMIWGPGKDDWNPMPCEPVAKPEDIPADNLTSPLWPKDFTVEEYASLTFPGRDPCKINFKNSTYTLEFATTPEGPVYHTIGRTGPSGPSPVPGKSWALPNGNFYNTVDVFGRSTFCICLGPVDPVVDNAITGPLSYDFNRGAKLVGRERVRPEYMDVAIVADHWVKGPHHFWIEVNTNQMVREWQPFNGLQTYHDWNYTKPTIELEEICYKGFLHRNVSCKGAPPS